MAAEFCFTVDLDRDVNIRDPENPAVALSADRGDGTEPRFASTLRGLEVLVGLLDDLSMPCTFFCEGHTLEVIRDHAGLLDGFEIGIHGYDHEYFPSMARPDSMAAVVHGCEAVKDVTGRSPTCFRAPYMKMPRDIGDFLKGTGIHVDSSSYAPADRCIPSMLPGYIAEVPVADGKDFNGNKISAYLWPMHEGKRGPLDYADLAQAVPDEGCFVLADHSWHMVELRDGGVMSEDAVSENVARTCKALEAIIDLGCAPVTISEASRLAAF